MKFKKGDKVRDGWGNILTVDMDQDNPNWVLCREPVNGLRTAQLVSSLELVK